MVAVASVATAVVSSNLFYNSFLQFGFILYQNLEFHLYLIHTGNMDFVSLCVGHFNSVISFLAQTSYELVHNQICRLVV